MNKHLTKHVANVTFLDPDNKLSVSVEIRKDTKSGLLIGLDAAYLANLDGDPEKDNPLSPYEKDVMLVVPDDEEGGTVQFDLTKPQGHTVTPESSPVVVFEWHGEGETPYKIADNAYGNFIDSADAPVCTVLMPDGTTHTVDLLESDESQAGGLNRTLEVVEAEIATVENEAHGPNCAMRMHSASECTCGKVDRLSALQDELTAMEGGEL